jgi:hypothetical protein
MSRNVFFAIYLFSSIGNRTSAGSPLLMFHLCISRKKQEGATLTFPGKPIENCIQRIDHFSIEVAS